MSEQHIFGDEIVGDSFLIKRELEFIRKVARSDKSILILGETGTGKELAARKIHNMSERRGRPFVAINCADIPEELFEAELYGFERGSFTGAIRKKQGLLETAQNGTVFLDEIGDLSLNFQAKLLRVIDQKEVRRVGETSTRTIGARFVFATNKDLKEEVKLGRFRRDLYFRIGVVKFCIPPLRNRKEDVALLVQYILKKENSKSGVEKGITSAALEKLMTYHFPGNVRELENIIERAYLLSEDSGIDEEDIRFDYELNNGTPEPGLSREHLRQTLEHCRWNKTRAASELGTSRRQFYRLLEKYRLTECIRRTYLL